MSHDGKICKDFNIKEKSRSLIVIPISHITSQFYAMLIRRAVGATLVYNPHTFNPNILLDTLIQEKIDDVVLPFGLYYAITRKEIKKGQLNLQTPICGGEPTPYRSTNDINKRLSAAGSQHILVGAGSTEFGSGIMCSYGINDRCNESGCFFPGASGFIVDPNTGKKINEIGKRGILYANAPWQMEGYLNDEKATSEFYHYIDESGKCFGTNNDITEIVGNYYDDPIYSILGRAQDFVLETGQHKYYPGVKYTNGRIQKIDFESGDFLFDMRDILLSIEGIMEAQPVIVPLNANTNEGTVVANVTVSKDYSLFEILKAIYNFYHCNKNEIIPSGILFRTRFAKSLSTDKRETISLIDVRTGYYYIDEFGKLYSVTIPENHEVILKPAEGKDIVAVEPPEPKKVFSQGKERNKEDVNKKQLTK